MLERGDQGRNVRREERKDKMRNGGERCRKAVCLHNGIIERRKAVIK
jgi:hypothetical protein